MTRPDRPDARLAFTALFVAKRPTPQHRNPVPRFPQCHVLILDDADRPTIVDVVGQALRRIDPDLELEWRDATALAATRPALLRLADQWIERV